MTVNSPCVKKSALVEVMKSPEFAGLALGSTQLAKTMRATCAGVMSNIEAAFAAP